MRPASPIALPVLVLAACVAAAQSPVMFETTVEVVRLRVTVTRGGDHFVTGLEASDFQILENNVASADDRLQPTERTPDPRAAARHLVVHDGPAARGSGGGLQLRPRPGPDDLVQVAQFKDRSPCCRTSPRTARRSRRPS